MQQVFQCPRCGTSNYWGQPFCVGCGAPLTASCPRCGAWLSPSAGFCTNCGAQAGGSIPSQPGYPGQPAYPGYSGQPAKQHKPMSGWGKFGTALFVLGVILIVAGPVFIMTRPEAEQSTSMLIKVVAAGGVGLIIGLPLMFKG